MGGGGVMQPANNLEEQRAGHAPLHPPTYHLYTARGNFLCGAAERSAGPVIGPRRSC